MCGKSWQEGKWKDRLGGEMQGGGWEQLGQGEDKRWLGAGLGAEHEFHRLNLDKRDSFEKNWARGNWMRRLGMDPDVFNNQENSVDSDVSGISSIYDSSTGGSGGKNKSARLASNKSAGIGKKKLTIKPKSYA